MGAFFLATLEVPAQTDQVLLVRVCPYLPGPLCRREPQCANDRDGHRVAPARGLALGQPGSVHNSLRVKWQAIMRSKVISAALTPALSMFARVVHGGGNPMQDRDRFVFS